MIHIAPPPIKRKRRYSAKRIEQTLMLLTTLSFIFSAICLTIGLLVIAIYATK